MINSTISSYKVIQKIGQGGFCEVYRAQQTNLEDRLVAIKVLLDEYKNDKDMLEDYLISQTELTARLNHPNIVTIYDAGWDNKKYFVAMKYLKGKTLASLLDEKNILSSKQVFSLLRQLASAIDFTHRANVFHRDINPTNIIVDEKDKITLIGFKMKVPKGVVIGTPGYMSPEQLMGEKIDTRTDIYALGVVAFELLTGKNPFGEGGLSEMISQQINYPPPNPSDFNKNLPKEIDQVIKKALAKNPQERYYQAKAFLYELENIYFAEVEKTPLILSIENSQEEKLIQTILQNKVISHRLAIPCENRLEKIIAPEQKIKIKSRWVYQSIPKLKLVHPKDNIVDEFIIIGALKLDDGDYLMLAERALLEQDQHLILVKIVGKHTLETVTAEVIIKYLGRIQSEVLEQTQGISKSIIRALLGDLPEVTSENELELEIVKPISIRCFACDGQIEHIAENCPYCKVERLAPNCPECDKPVADWKDKKFLGSFSVYTWNSGWDGRCKHCGLEFESKFELKTGHHWADRGPSSEIKISGNESSTTVFLDYWQHLPTIEISIDRVVPGGRLAKEEKITLTIEEFEAISKQLESCLNILLKRKTWSEDTT
ncbi:MAG: serine/threonine protein kinase [Acidobacteria bacterium]|nr:serine/threonine protein kinase [Acidobacteriota bacterium]